MAHPLRYGLAVLLLGTGLTSPVLAATWPTTEFIFENKNPSVNSVLDSINPFTGYSSAQEAAVAELERHLSKVASYYQFMGFKAPPLQIIDGRKGGKAYRVYLYDYDDKDPIARAGPRPGGSSILLVDLSRAIVDGKPAPRMYEDLAHELFHNVQHAYISHAQIDDRDWIVEGQAQAVGMEAARKLAGVDMYKGKEDGFRLGGRPYYKALWQPDLGKKEEYRTSSFWRYVAEHYAAAKDNGRPGLKPTAPDYSYLKTVLSQPLADRASGPADGQWLDRGLRKATGLGLQRMYAAFVSTFAGYVPDRLTKAPGGTAQQAQDNWLKYVFGGCTELALSGRAPSGDTLLPLRKNGARCFKVNVAGTGRADVSLQARAETVAALQALQIGTAGGARIGSAQIVPSPAGGGYLGHWRFRIDSGVPTVFIVSNMAADPATTLNTDLQLNATYSRWVSDLSQPRKQAQASPPSKATSAKAKAAPSKQTRAKDATRSAARNEVETGLEALSNQTALGAHATFERKRARCVKPFGASSCGPITSIQLSLTPGAMGDMTQTTGTGGGLAQFMAQMTAIADHGALSTDSQWKQAMEEVRDTEGSTVTITIPLIEYGFTGAFDNAEIVVNGGAGRGNLQAKGPEDAIPGRGQEYRQSGRVSIEEFTPYVMRGRFEANLTDLSAVDFSNAGEDMPLPVDRTIRGEFVIAAPWEGDPEAADYLQQTTEAGMQDLSQAFPALGNQDLASIMPPDARGGQPGGTGGNLPSSPVQDFPRCACDCQPIATLSPECKPICKVKLLACWAEDSRQKKLAQQLRPAAEPAAPVRQSRTEYIEGLRREGMSQAQIDRIMPGVDAFWAENGGWPKK
ncbi:hypothetical protein JN531_012940 [Flagellatimonas centrodinii]|uniref:hypothetical protein n=1 Tax=Flagellatimonas centrodinii TaxID=2806210 RepID=UPI001FF0512A|nr:hypothetical protein [Flagellatimonas centrodinii]ULQ46003.1 hypothetical protein JN531_012940 [Flagellatimonas centrodinii]